MINGITNILTNQSLVNLSQNTAARVSIETGLKAAGRPSFILIDKDLDKETKKYAATKELLYQLICLGVYLAIIPTLFKKGSFTLAKNHMYKNNPNFTKFKNTNEFLNFHKLASMDKSERLSELGKNKVLKKLNNREDLIAELKNNENPANQYYLQKGVIEGGSFVGSILGLALLAPEVSHKLIHPLMRMLGLEKKEEAETTKEVK